MLLHGLQERRLYLRRRAVDLVGQDDVCEDRALLRLKLRRLGVVDQRANQISRQEVGRELNALERSLDHFGQRADRERLRQPWHTLHENMAIRQ